MQIALVAVVLLAGMWFTVLKPKPDAGPSAPAAQPTAPGAAGLARAVSNAKGAAAASDATNARIQKATGGSVTTPAAAKPATTKAVAAAKPAATKAAPAKPAAAKPAAAKPAAAKPAAAKPAAAKPATDTAVDPSTVLLRFLAQGKTVVLLFHGNGADDKAARKAVHRVAASDKKVVAAYADISKVAAYRAITTDVEVTTAPTILVIGKNKKAVTLTGFVDYGVVRQTVGDVRRAADKPATAAKK